MNAHVECSAGYRGERGRCIFVLVGPQRPAPPGTKTLH